MIVVNILGTIDDKIENNEKKIEKLENLALYKIQSSRICEYIPLENIAQITMGQSPKGLYLNNSNGTVFYQGKTDFGKRYPQIRMFTTSITRLANANDILFSVRAPVGDINITLQKCCIGRGLAAIKSKNYNNLLFYILKLSKNEFEVYNNSGTVFGSIDKKSLGNIKISLPENSDELESYCLNVNRQCIILYEQIEKLKILKQLYLKKFFN